MNLKLVIAREIKHRKGSFAIGVLSVAVAVGCLAGARTLLRGHDLRTEEVLLQKEAETRQAMAGLEDDYRRIMRRLGYNVLILHRDQSFTELRAHGYPTVHFPEEYAERLGRGGIETLNHLLPVLQEKILWPEQNREVLLTGIRGQVPVYHKAHFLTDEGQYRSPIMDSVPKGKADVGFDLAQELGLKPGGVFQFQDRSFTVNRVYPRRGSQDDITLWVHLATAQEILDRPGSVNGILALECVCDFDALGAIQEEVSRILPDARVLEFGSLVRVRSEARQRAAEAHVQAVEAEKIHRAQMRQERESTAGILIPVVMLGAAGAIFFLMLNNGRERRMEIGILRAVGWRERQLMTVFLGRAFLLGAAGVLPGFLAGYAFGSFWSGVPLFSREGLALFEPRLLAAIFIAAPLTTALAGSLPAWLAARQDPAAILREQ
jgi:putative ABC transport system permease protein